MKSVKINYLIFFLFFTSMLIGQTNKSPFQVNLSEDGSKYIKFGANLQVWGRYTELNPDSQVGDNIENINYDIVVRRLRLQAMGMITDNIFIHLQVGQNNINFQSNSSAGNAPLAILDALAEYHFSPKINIGGGLTGWGAGTTRYSAQSSSTQLPLDAPIYQQLINTSSTFGNRNLSIYAKGTFDKINYHVAITNPYRYSTNHLDFNSTISTETPHAQYSGIVTYAFLEKESNIDPYSKGTYLGTKKVFNLGLGYMQQTDDMWHLDESNPTEIQYNDMNVLGFDVFYDSPLSENGNAITLYAAYNNCDFGKNYIRAVATPNPALTNNALINGSGNGFIGVGTGNIYYGQVGYLFRKSENAKIKGKTQVYATGQIADLEALKTPMTMYELGANYYLTGALGPKITLGYQNRAIFEKTIDGNYPQSDRKSMLVLQFQASF